ncbi:MAG TPA: 5'/3'-nucleotidase SurE [Alphaproteobacteria bacterium]|nr:5'/3'-nucleotidase SurE [Alphaproteobacteria bacterium]
MADALPKLSKARILVSNDDGIHAPGLKLLERVARSLSDDVWVVAPEAEQSGASHGLTLRRSLALHKVGRRRYAVGGTPSDSVLMAVKHIMTDKAPDLVLSGVNRGANLGEDIIYSGTVAAAREAALLGIPSIAFSQVRKGDYLPWKTAEAFAPGIIRKLYAVAWPKGVLMNVNFPPVQPGEVTGVKVAPQGRRVEHTHITRMKDPAGRDMLWIGDFPTDDPLEHETDLGAVLDRMVSVTPLHCDLTHGVTLQRIAGLFGKPKRARKAARR